MRSDIRELACDPATHDPLKEAVAILALVLVLGCGSLPTPLPSLPASTSLPATATPAPPTATMTPVPPTRAATSTPIPPATFTPGATVTPVCAQCTITVTSARDEGTRVLYDAAAGGTTITVEHPNTHFLVVQAHIEGMSDADVEGIGWLLILMIDGKQVRDRDGNTYACTYSWSGHPTTERSRDITYYFEVPDDVVVADFVWFDRPPIPLGGE